MGHSFHCPCGYSVTNGTLDDLEHIPQGSCCNCGGRLCMDCVLRYMHDECEHSCPSCYIEGWTELNVPCCDKCDEPADWTGPDCAALCDAHYFELAIRRR